MKPSFSCTLLAAVIFGALLIARGASAGEAHQAQQPITSGASSQYVTLPIVIVTEKYPADNRAFEHEVLRLINEQRVSLGLPALLEQHALTQAARRHAEDMAAHQSSSHIGSDGSSPGDRMQQEGYAGLACGEATSLGRTTPAEVVIEGWMRSLPHRAILLDPQATEAGVGYADDFAWTLDTGR